ncbi:ATP-binding protein [Frankia sp. Ag45/Mut15]|uniref:ATP-binding protein n=1 Tax=Frankia umida TaxID=573489 RepID=A0ABT0K2A5_9ACTN|nr:ATP-binding protein [Frankia umida]MCK9877617.1 ATP-binding protein [Frankia umida]
MLDGFQFHRILSAPRRPDPGAGPDPVPSALFAALVGAHAELIALEGEGRSGTGLALAWLRGPGETHIQVLAGGRPYFPPDTAALTAAVLASPPAPTGPEQHPDDPPRGLLEGAWPGHRLPRLPPPPGSPPPGVHRSGEPQSASRRPDQHSDPVPMLYPPGATARPVPSETVAANLARLPYWLRCAGAPDALWANGSSGQPGGGNAAGGGGGGGPRRGSFDDYAAHLSGPFAWLVVAWPVPPEHLEAERDALTRSIPALRMREHDQGARLDLERAENRHRELGRAAASGMWDVEILVGAASRASAFSVAALLGGASDLDDLPYTLRPLGPVSSLAGALAARTPPGSPASARSPFRAGAELLAALARPPARELPGITLVTPHTFDVTPEGPNRTGPADPTGSPGAVRLGDVLDAGWSPAGTLSVTRATLNRHAFVCGATGSGKSQTVRGLLESLTRMPDAIPWLVLEPAKAEYARMAGRLADLTDPAHPGGGGRGEVLVIRPGRLDAPPASLNPLEPEAGFPLQSHLDLVRALFLAAFEAHEPFPQVLARALTACYVDLGWNLVLDRPEPAHRPRLHVRGPRADPLVDARRRYPTLGDLQRTATRTVENIGYGAEVTADVRGFVDVRIGSLRQGSPGRFFEGGHPLDIGALLTRNVVFELEDITSDQDKAFLLGAVLIRVVEHLRVRYGATGAGGLRHVLVVEEAHRLLKNVTDGPAAAAVELFASLLAEIRAYGEGLVVVEQIPAKILPDVIKNTALKVMHRLPAADDREAVGATMNLRPEQSEVVVALPAGVAAVSVDGMDRPVLARMTAGDARESTRQARHVSVPLAARRSPRCGPVCRTERPCDLGETETAALAANDPLVVLWVEALAAHQVMGFAHLLREDPFGPSAALRAQLEAARPRHLDCLLAHAVDRAVAARATLLAPFVDPDEFADALHATLRRRLAGPADTGDRDGTDSRRLTAGVYRWQDIRVALGEAVGRDGENAPPHPLTDAWYDRGLDITGDTLGEQLSWLRTSTVYTQGADQVCLGDTTGSGLLEAVRKIGGGTDQPAVLRAVRRACDGPHLADLVDQIANLLHADSP